MLVLETVNFEHTVRCGGGGGGGEGSIGNGAVGNGAGEGPGDDWPDAVRCFGPRPVPVFSGPA